MPLPHQQPLDVNTVEVGTDVGDATAGARRGQEGRKSDKGR